MNKHLKLAIALAIPLVVWVIPTSAIPIEGLTVMAHRVLVVFAFAVSFWILEPIAIWATSVCIAVILLLITSTSGIGFMIAGADEPGFGKLVGYKDYMYQFSHPIIMLFLGGFFLAMAATKYRLDTNMARVLLKPFGTNPTMVMMGLMIVTAIFSMFMSNTATTAMMLAVLAPVLAALPKEDPGRIALALSIPTAANIGGIGTPIGTPPNAVVLGALDEAGHPGISFAGWMLIAVPYVVVMLTIAWFVLIFLYKPQTKEMQVDIKSKWLKTPKAIVVYVVFAATILLWLTGMFHGMKSYTVAMLPVAVFSASGIITAKDLKTISWDVLWLVAGGFALGLAMKQTGLSEMAVNSIPFSSMPTMVLVVAAGFITMTMATFMSNTATANLLVPIFVTLAFALEDQLGSVGGPMVLILGATFAASLGMALPISTPPNAMAHATGNVTSGQMAKAGVINCLIGLVLAYILLFVVAQIGLI